MIYIEKVEEEFEVRKWTIGFIIFLISTSSFNSISEAKTYDWKGDYLYEGSGVGIMSELFIKKFSSKNINFTVKDTGRTGEVDKNGGWIYKSYSFSGKAKIKNNVATYKKGSCSVKIIHNKKGGKKKYLKVKISSSCKVGDTSQQYLRYY